MLPSDFPAWYHVWYYYRTWHDDGTWEHINTLGLMLFVVVCAASIVDSDGAEYIFHKTEATKPTEILDLTRLRLDEFHLLGPAFETAFQADMQEWRLDGKPLKNVPLVNATLTILFLSDKDQGSAHDKRSADATPDPLPSGSHLLQDLGFLAFTLDGVSCITPFKKPRGGTLSDEQKAFNHNLIISILSFETCFSKHSMVVYVYHTCTGEVRHAKEVDHYR